MSKSCSPSAYCANYCDPSHIHGCCFSSCCKSGAPCNEYNHICCPGGCPCPCIRPYGSTCYRPICKCCCPPPPKIPSKCRYVPKIACGCGCLPC